jgi:hypothetical protein
MMDVVERHLDDITNASFAHYGLTKYLLLATLKKLLNSDELGKVLCQTPHIAFQDKKMECVLKLIDDLMTSIVIDLNHEITQGQLSDYKSDLKSRNSGQKLIGELLRSYEKDKARGKADSIADRLKACEISKPIQRFGLIKRSK